MSSSLAIRLNAANQQISMELDAGILSPVSQASSTDDLLNGRRLHRYQDPVWQGQTWSCTGLIPEPEHLWIADWINNRRTVWLSDEITGRSGYGILVPPPEIGESVEHKGIRYRQISISLDLQSITLHPYAGILTRLPEDPTPEPDGIQACYMLHDGEQVPFIYQDAGVGVAWLGHIGRGIPPLIVEQEAEQHMFLLAETLLNFVPLIIEQESEQYAYLLQDEPGMILAQLGIQRITNWHLSEESTDNFIAQAATGYMFLRSIGGAALASSGVAYYWLRQDGEGIVVTPTGDEGTQVMYMLHARAEELIRDCIHACGNPYMSASVQSTQIDFGAATLTYDPGA